MIRELLRAINSGGNGLIDEGEFVGMCEMADRASVKPAAHSSDALSMHYEHG